MYTPPQFRMDDRAEIHRAIRASRLANLVTMNTDGLSATPLPLFLDETEGDQGVLYGHVARANLQWSSALDHEALAIFTGPNAYVTPSWYATKALTGKVVPTWNYIAVHAHGPVEFFEDADRLLAVITRLTRLYEEPRRDPWAVTDAPAPFVAAQIRAIVGVRMVITRLYGKRKMSQNRTEEDRAGVANGLAESSEQIDRDVAELIPR